MVFVKLAHSAQLSRLQQRLLQSVLKFIMVKKYLKLIENMLSYETDLQSRMRKAVNVNGKETITVRHSKYGTRYYLTKKRADGSYSRTRIKEDAPIFKVLLRKRTAAAYLKTVDANVSLIGNFLATTIYLWLITLTASKELPILLLSCIMVEQSVYRFPFLDLASVN